MVERLKATGQGRRYDAMIGLSGGIDSAWLAHLMHGHGLRLLAVHVDGGWNSEPAVRNIETIVRKLDLDLHTVVIEWAEMRDLQRAFLRASVVNQDMPQDHAFFATLYHTAARFGIGHFLSGVNFASESIVGGAGSGFPSMDGAHIRAVHARFGAVPLRQYPIMTLPTFLWMTRVRRILTVFKPLNYTAYDKEFARAELTRRYGWRDYGGKHSESRFTKFYQDVYLPQKFDFDKRRLHLSSLIVSGQLTRQQALLVLATPIVEERQARRDTRFVAKKLGLPIDELASLIAAPVVEHRRYPNQFWLFAILSRVWALWQATRVIEVKLRKSYIGDTPYPGSR